MRPLRNKTPNPRNPQRLTHLTRLRLNQSHLRDHQFKRNFLDTVNLLCFMALVLKRLLNFSSMAQTFLKKGLPFWVKFLKLIVTY